MSPYQKHLVPPEKLGGGGFPSVLAAFWKWQTEGWPRLAEARTGLLAVRTRDVIVDARTMALQWNPGRAVNTTAKVDAKTISARPCFLCPVNLPDEEGALAFGDDLVILPNPAPILDPHLVIASVAHVPQRIDKALDPLLRFAEAAGGKMTAVYNGPTSGASAPDHLHLQGVPSKVLPEERVAREALALGLPAGNRIGGNGFHAWMTPDVARPVLGLRGSRAAVDAAVRTAISCLATPEGADEPPLNVLATALPAGGAAQAELLVLLFPRGAHRPACYFADEPDKRLVSPGAIDMAGLVVTVRESDFDALDADALEQIFGEVALPEDATDDWVRTLTKEWSGSSDE